jgi:DnaJ-domain-containing protein 1
VELATAYRAAIKMNHPDKVAALAAEFKTLAETRTKVINQAYSKLRVAREA